MGIAVVLGYFLLRATASVLHWSTIQAQRNVEHAAIGELVDRWRADEDSAWAIFTPNADVNGVSNSDGHEVDFFNRDAKYQSYFWAYNYNAQGQTLTRYLYSAPGAAPVVDTTYSGITRFYAHTYPVNALQDPSSKIYSPLYNAATLQPGAVRFYGAGNPLIAGGNQITYVRVEGPTLVREMQLSTQTAPSGFTVVLSYTPAPTPTTAAAASLQAWPQFIELPMQGAALQTSSLPDKQDMAYYVNRLLGGGTATAAVSPCAVNQARAFTDATFTKPLASATPPPGAMPAGVAARTDAGGCITINDAIGSNVELYEPGNTTALQQTGTTCASAVSVASANPASQAGSHVGLRTQARTQLVSDCTMSWSDLQQHATLTTVTYEVAGCTGVAPNTQVLVGIGATCTSVDSKNYSANSTPPDCTPGGSGGTQYTDNGIGKVTGPGTAVDNGDFTVTVTRTGIGTITASLQIGEVLCNGLKGTKFVNGSETFTFDD